jgi:hypothetical protein
MGSRSAAALLHLPVRLRGIRLAQPVDLLLDTTGWRALGFVVLCGDDETRFLPYAAARPGPDEIAVGSALTLLEDVEFYRRRSESLRALIGEPVRRGPASLGILRDVLLGADGIATALAVERPDGIGEVDLGRALVTSGRASAA